MGNYNWKDGRKYYGLFKDNDMHGYGVYYYPDGVVYKGCFYEDKKDGYGHYYWTDGRVYDGWWLKGKQHGLGSYFDPFKKKAKKGIWENGKRLMWFTTEQVRII